MVINQEKFFKGLDFEKFEMNYGVYGNYTCYKGSDGFFYRVDHFGNSYVIEDAENEEEARIHRFEDADLFDDSLPEEELIKEIQNTLLGYIEEAKAELISKTDFGKKKVA